VTGRLDPHVGSPDPPGSGKPRYPTGSPSRIANAPDAQAVSNAAATSAVAAAASSYRADSSGRPSRCRTGAGRAAHQRQGHRRPRNGRTQVRDTDRTLPTAGLSGT
jgi:hypothetical protein